MGQFFDEIPEFLLPWIEKQQMFWTASAPLSGLGHVNLSPKCTRGLFHIINANRVWYEDMTGSGIETISHLKEPGNGRVTILFHAFEGPPRICRLFGTGTVHEYGTSEYNELIPPGTRAPGSRAAIVIDIHKVGTSCGYAIPFYEFKSHRNRLLLWAQDREGADNETLQQTNENSPKGMARYWRDKNAQSIDALPALDTKTSDVAHPFEIRKTSYNSDDNSVAASVHKAGVMFGGNGMLDTRFLIGLVLGVGLTLMMGHLTWIILAQ